MCRSIIRELCHDFYETIIVAQRERVLDSEGGSLNRERPSGDDFTVPHRLRRVRRIHDEIGVVCGWNCRRLAIQVRHRRPCPLCGARAHPYRRI